MFEQLSACRLTCQGCGAILWSEWKGIRDVRVFVRSLGWWCAEEAQTIDRQHVWHVRCPACGAPKEGEW